MFSAQQIGTKSEEIGGIVIDCNLNLNSLEQIKKYINDSHGLSLIAISMLDSLNKNLQITLKTGSEILVESIVEQIMGVWNKYEPISSFIRSCRVDGKYLEELDGQKMKDNGGSVPCSTEDFLGKKVIIDIEKEDHTCVFKLYRWAEIVPRILTVEL